MEINHHHQQQQLQPEEEEEEVDDEQVEEQNNEYDKKYLILQKFINEIEHIKDILENEIYNLSY